jgi:pimeloyl-ACP methyl ester carboxylesterase
MSSVPACAQARNIVGDWSGALAVPTGELSIVVRISEMDGVVSGTLESPDQAPGRLTSITIIENGPDRFAFAAPAYNASYAGAWDEALSGWSGSWSQSGIRLPLVLRRTAATRVVVEGLDAAWEGRVEREGRSFRLVFRITTDNRGTTVKFDAPDAGATNLSATVSREGGAVRFTVPATGARFDGVLAPGGDRLSGKWTYPGRPDAHIEFARRRIEGSYAPRPRPQTPRAPFPYHVEEVAFANPLAPGVTLAATLTLPAGAGPFPAAILITGSGPQDRDESVFGHKPFAVLADHLTRSGVAVLRYDDRGVAKSTGAGSFVSATTADFASDADAAVSFLALRAEIDTRAIGLIGHSEGGLAAAIAASANQQVAYVVLLATPFTDIRRVMLTQQRVLGPLSGVPENTLASAEPILANLIDAVASARSDQDAAARVEAILTPERMVTLDIPQGYKELFVQQMANPWMRHLLNIDPPRYLSQIRVPVLALNGSLDRQVVAADNLAGIRSSLSRSGDVTVRELPGLNHMFQTARSGSPAEYAEIPETFSPAALEAMSAWIGARFSR